MWQTVVDSLKLGNERQEAIFMQIDFAAVVPDVSAKYPLLPWGDVIA